MSIQELAEKLDACANSLPGGILLQAQAEVDATRATAYSLLGTGAHSDNVYGAIQAVEDAITATKGAVVNAKTVIATAAAHHMQAGA